MEVCPFGYEPALIPMNSQTCFEELASEIDSGLLNDTWLSGHDCADWEDKPLGWICEADGQYDYEDNCQRVFDLGDGIFWKEMECLLDQIQTEEN
eukprot:UN32627